MQLIKATLSDIPYIAEAAKRIWTEHYLALLGERQLAYMLEMMYSDVALEKQMLEEGVTFWLPVEKGQRLGFVAISEKSPGQGFIHKFYIDNGLRGQGLGSRIFDLIRAEYPHFREIRLTVNRQNYKSINFYFKLGFTIESVEDFDIGGGYLMEDFVLIVNC